MESVIMGSINLYKIDIEKKDELIKTLSLKLEQVDTLDIDFEKSEKISFTLYTQFERNEKVIPWNWVLSEFSRPIIKTVSSPKAVLLAEKEDNTTYAITFGSSFFLIDKFCDRDFGFNFARKLSFDKIKTTTLTTPSSHRNKTVSTYVNYDELEFDSGESFAKLKARVDVEKDFDLFNPSIEIGNSIKMSISTETLSNVAKKN